MTWNNLRYMAAVVLAVNLAVVTPSGLVAASRDKGDGDSAARYETTTPIKHLVVIFQENVSFDHYFATYPNALNQQGETPFVGKANTPAVNGLTQGQIELNQSSFKPIRLAPSQNYTCDQDHDYTPEQQAFDSGLMDKFPEFTATACGSSYPTVQGLGLGIVMGYYDGNTVTALWNYAQYFAMDDNHFGTNFGPSTPGAINVISGMTAGADPANDSNAISDGAVARTSNGDVVVGDDDAFYDDCGSSSPFGMVATNQNIGTLLTSAKISWGWFQGGFTPTTPSVNGSKAVCAATTKRLDGTPEAAYSSHHNPFDYYAATANPHHLPPANLAEVGHDGPANHQYDISYFTQAALAGDLPAVSYLKAPRANDGHPGNSSPLDEQVFITKTINMLESLPTWSSTAVIITWDDSDGWFDHQMSPIINQSMSPQDALTGAGMCGTGANSLEAIQARCGYGPRIPFFVISPYSRGNYVDHSVIDQSSVVRFIEDNWGLPRIGNGSFDAYAGSIMSMFDLKHQGDNRLFLDPLTGQVVNRGGN